MRWTPGLALIIATHYRLGKRILGFESMLVGDRAGLRSSVNGEMKGHQHLKTVDIRK